MDKLKVPFGDRWYEFLTRTEAGYDVTVTDEIVVREIFVENVYQVFAGDLDDTGVVVDIGGNVGAFDIYCTALGAKSVHTYEPDSDNWEVLLANIAANNLGDIIYPHNLGVSGSGGERELVQGQGASFLVGVKELTPAAAEHVDRAPKEAVQTISLASVFADNEIPYCDILKIDCEGSEYEIIAGADSDVLAKARYITLEFHAASPVLFGEMIAKLTLTHNIHLFGRHDYGGQLYARRY